MPKKIKKPKICPECSAEVNPENFEKHMRKAHAAEPSGKGPSAKKGRKLSEKRVKLQKARRKRNRNILVGGIFVACIIAILALNALNTPQPDNDEPEPVIPAPPGNAQEVHIAENTVTESAKFMSYNSNGVSVRFFSVRGTDGEVHVAADACDVCYQNKKGYTQSGNVMKCNNCGRTFAINSIGTENLSGGCWPSYIPMNIDGDKVVIKKSDLDAKRFMF